MTEGPEWNHSLEAEQAVLGILLLNNEAYDAVADLITDTSFYVGAHRSAYGVIRGLIDAGKPADLITVAERLAALDPTAFAEHGGAAYLARLAQTPGSLEAARHYAGIVRERSILRQLFAAATATRESVASFRGRTVSALLDEAEEAIMGIGLNAAGRSDFEPAKSALAKALEFIDFQYHRADPHAPTGLPYGFRDLDWKTSGMHPGQLIVVAARPAMGKSTFTLNVLEQAARTTGKTALFFTLEMGNREQAIRLIASRAMVNVQRLFAGRLNDTEWQRVTRAMGELHDLQLSFNERAGLTIGELRSLARRAMRESRGLSVIAVDYLQLMLSGDTDNTRANQIAEITRGLKLLAKELDIPVIVLSQLNRSLESRTNKRPIMSDLRDSGAIEQDADVILFIYRDEVYHPERMESRGIAEIIIGKQRNGPIGSIELRFRGDATRFMDLDHAQEAEAA